jgi:5-hydroxyisourate hydrolase-like protein (transthyretin family)
MKRILSISFVLALLLALVPMAVQPNHVAAAASLKISRGSAAAGDQIGVQGFGFAAQDDVVVALDLRVSNHAQEAQAVVQTNASGSFTATLVVPSGANQGTYPLTARDFHGNLATRNVTILPAAYVAPGGKVFTVWVIPQNAFYVRGGGFKPGETVRITASFPQYNGNSTVVNRTVGTTANGSFGEVLLQVPGGVKAGNVTLQATGQTSGRKGTNTLHVFYQPALSPTTQAVRPGQAVHIAGTGFVPGSTVHVSLTIPRTNAANLTLSRDVTANGNGAIGTSIGIPSDTSLGKYRITASDSVGGYHASAEVVVSAHPSIKLTPTTVLPGQAFTAEGDNFGTGVTVTVSASFSLQGGGHRTVSATTQTGANGDYSVKLAVPSNAAPGKATVTAQASNGKVSTSVQVKPRPPLPTATPVPTSTPVPPTSTSVPGTAVPPTSTATPPQKHGFGYRYVSIWYHTVRVGTSNHFVVQASLHTVQGIWINVFFPAGQHIAIYKNTDHNGKFAVTIQIPRNARTSTNSRVVVTFRLWHGKKSRRYFASFTLVG